MMEKEDWDRNVFFSKTLLNMRWKWKIGIRVMHSNPKGGVQRISEPTHVPDCKDDTAQIEMS